MAVPDPLVTGNESAPQNRQVTSNKVASRTKQRNGTTQQPTQDEGYYLKMTITVLDKSRRDPLFRFKVFVRILFRIHLVPIRILHSSPHVYINAS